MLGEMPSLHPAGLTRPGLLAPTRRDLLCEWRADMICEREHNAVSSFDYQDSLIEYRTFI